MYSTEANSEELDPETPDPVIVYMPEISKTHLGGTMRLGLRPTIFSEGTEEWSKIRKLYGGEEIIWERHRHRYEVGPSYVEKIEKSGLPFIGRDEKGERMQVFELKGMDLGILLSRFEIPLRHPVADLERRVWLLL